MLNDPVRSSYSAYQNWDKMPPTFENQISLKSIPEIHIDNKSALIQVMIR